MPCKTGSCLLTARLKYNTRPIVRNRAIIAENGRDRSARPLRGKENSRLAVPCNGVNHLDAVHQSRECVDDCRRGPTVERLDETLEGVEKFHVVFCLVRSFRDIHVNLAGDRSRIKMLRRGTTNNQQKKKQSIGELYVGCTKLVYPKPTCTACHAR